MPSPSSPRGRRYPPSWPIFDLSPGLSRMPGRERLVPAVAFVSSRRAGRFGGVERRREFGPSRRRVPTEDLARPGDVEGARMGIFRIDLGLNYSRQRSISLLEVGEGRRGFEGIGGRNDEYTLGRRWKLQGEPERPRRVSRGDVRAEERQRLTVTSRGGRGNSHRTGVGLLGEHPAYRLGKHDPCRA